MYSALALPETVSAQNMMIVRFAQWQGREPVLVAAAAQNIKRSVRFLSQPARAMLAATT